jgi:acyl carrier protein
MGLDTVELVMAIEEEFSIEIPNADAARLGVLGDLSDYVVAALRQRGETPDETQVWERLSALVVAQLGVRPEEVTRSAHVVKDLHAD